MSHFVSRLARGVYSLINVSPKLLGIHVSTLPSSFMILPFCQLVNIKLPKRILID
nr:MAG TPA: hypothetical protein [Caudoviricetes sp.]